MARDFKDEERRDLLERMEGWARRLRQDQSLPWIGMGFIKDLDLAIEHLGGAPADDGWNADHLKPRAAPTLEFDL